MSMIYRLSDDFINSDRVMFMYMFMYKRNYKKLNSDDFKTEFNNINWANLFSDKNVDKHMIPSLKKLKNSLINIFPLKKSQNVN